MKLCNLLVHVQFATGTTELDIQDKNFVTIFFRTKHFLQRPTLGSETTSDNWKSFKKAFYSILKALFFLEMFTFLSSIFSYIEKPLDKKAKIIFKIHDVTYLTTINYKHIWPNISRSKGNEIWSFNKIYRWKHFSSKIMHKMRHGY